MNDWTTFLKVVVSFQHYFAIHQSVFANTNKETSQLQQGKRMNII